MPDDLHRRWDDVVDEIRSQVPPAVRSAMVDYRITVEETARDVSQLKIVVFGVPSMGVRGMVERMTALEGKIDTLIQGQEQREADWKGMRVFLDQEKERSAIQQVIKRNIGRFQVLVGIVGGAIVILNLLQLFHIIKL